MKNTWNIRKNNDAVSPVIATILMVAITVVLAAVLYVMVIGFGGTETTAPAGQWNEAKATSQTEGELEFGTFTTSVPPISLEIIVKANGTAAGKITIPSNDGAAPQTMTWTWTGKTTEVAEYYDYSPGGATINSGDYITFTGLLPGTTYSFELFHVPSQSTVQMTGISGSFQTAA